MENIKVDNREWIFRGDGKNCTQWSSSWFCSDGDGVSLYIDNKENNISIGFQLNCFSGIPASQIYIDNVDFGTMWKKAKQDIPIGIYDYEEQCVIIADYLCSLFCEWIDTTEYKNS